MTGASEGADGDYNDMIGDMVTDVRISAPDGSGGAQRIVIIFDSGASILIDGTFPARAVLADAEAFRDAVSGCRFEGIGFSKTDLVSRKDGSAEEKFVVTVATGEGDVAGEWRMIHSPGFDVGPEPRIVPRSAPNYGAGCSAT